jgi:hypothetical protein
VLCLESRYIGAHLRVTPVSLQKCTDPLPRIAEERLVDEFNRRGRPLDIQEDGTAFLQLDAVLSGIYVGPMQSG